MSILAFRTAALILVLAPALLNDSYATSLSFLLIRVGRVLLVELQLAKRNKKKIMPAAKKKQEFNNSLSSDSLNFSDDDESEPDTESDSDSEPATPIKRPGPVAGAGSPLPRKTSNGSSYVAPSIEGLQHHVSTLSSLHSNRKSSGRTITTADSEEEHRGMHALLRKESHMQSFMQGTFGSTANLHATATGHSYGPKSFRNPNGMGNRVAGSHSPGGAASPVPSSEGEQSPKGSFSPRGKDGPKTVNGTLKLRKIIGEITAARTALRVNSEDIGDAQFQRIAESRRMLEHAKQKAAQAICAIGERISVEAFEIKRQCIQLVDDIFAETDHRPGNSQLLAALSRIHSVEMPTSVITRGWLLQCARDGSADYMNLFLGMPEVVETLQEFESLQALMIACSKNNSYRPRLFSVLLARAKSIKGFAIHKKNLAMAWQQAFELIAAKPKSDADESNVGRIEALEKMISEPLCAINFMRESSTDNQTVFSRLARDGEVQLLHKIISETAAGAVDINKVQPDGSTALMQAVVRNEVKVVAFLLKQKNIDLWKTHPTHGNAVEIAIKMQKDPRIINMLREKAKESREAGAEEPEFLLSAEELQKKAKAKEQKNTLVDGTEALKPMFIGAKPLFEHVENLARQNANPRTLREQVEALERAKLNIAQKTHSLSNRVELQEPQRTELIELCEMTVVGTDRRGGGVEFLEAMCSHIVNVDWPKTCVERRWLIASADNSSWRYIDYFLGLEGIREALPTEQLLEMLKICVRHRTLRIPMTKTVLSHEENLMFDVRRDHLSPIFNEFAINIASQKRAIVREDRNGRMEVLTRLVRHEYLLVDPELEDQNDNQTMFSRAAQEGDVELLKLLTESKGGNYVRDLNRVQRDGTNALVQAVIENQTAAVEILVKRGANPNHRTPNGTPVDVAMSLKRDPLIIAQLTGQAGLSAMGMPNGSSPGSARSLGSHRSLRSLKDTRSSDASSAGDTLDRTTSTVRGMTPPRSHIEVL